MANKRTQSQETYKHFELVTRLHVLLMMWWCNYDVDPDAVKAGEGGLEENSLEN